jgi:hypothetical protein
MIHKIQNIHGIVYVVSGMNKNFIEEIKKVFEQIIEEKKLPFSSIYLKFPVFASNQISSAMENFDIKPKNIMKKKNVIVLEF